ncbi:MAG: tungsten formylmethanofuran dehydrogenase [Methanobacteriota archaeon]|nr:MAG: tungsten formylmethanofuran dehydrogenase [Euryarchaeota archaeon]
MVTRGFVTIDKDRCKSCGLCVEHCPKKLLRISNELYHTGFHPAEWVDPKGECTGCGICYTHCPDAAITIRVYRKKREKT